MEHLLPTPAARDFKSGKSNIMDRNARPLNEVIETGMFLPVSQVVDWGVYARAVLRWAQVTGVLPPHPVEPMKRRGRRTTQLGANPQTGMRLSPLFVEWMQGLPVGWVTAVPGLSRNAQLKALGNGVVPQSAALALAIMLPRAAVLSRFSASRA